MDIKDQMSIKDFIGEVLDITGYIRELEKKTVLSLEQDWKTSRSLSL